MHACQALLEDQRAACPAHTTPCLGGLVVYGARRSDNLQMPAWLASENRGVANAVRTCHAHPDAEGKISASRGLYAHFTWHFNGPNFAGPVPVRACACGRAQRSFSSCPGGRAAPLPPHAGLVARCCHETLPNIWQVLLPLAIRMRKVALRAKCNLAAGMLS